MVASENDYDWVGRGIYFWEYNALRAYEFACEVRERSRIRTPKIKQPAVVGAIIDLGECLNLLDSRFIDIVKKAHEDLTFAHEEAQEPIPSNSGGPDRLLRRLDYAVIQMLHTTREHRNEPAFDTVRAAFIEGEPLYKGAGFYTKNHIQICVRNLSCVKGYFRPIGEDGRPLSFT